MDGSRLSVSGVCRTSISRFVVGGMVTRYGCWWLSLSSCAWAAFRDRFRNRYTKRGGSAENTDLCYFAPYGVFSQSRYPTYFC